MERFLKPSKDRGLKRYKGYTLIPWINSWIIKETKEVFRTLKDAKDRITYPEMWKK